MNKFDRLLEADPRWHALFPNSEAMAAHVGENYTLLRARLMSARSVLLKQYRSSERRPSFDFANKRLILHNGYALQWQLRDDPAAPISYENQQTNIGGCSLIRLR